MTTELEKLENDVKTAKDEVLEAAFLHGLALKGDFKKLTADVRQFSQDRYNSTCIRYAEAVTAHAEAAGKVQRLSEAANEPVARAS